MNLIAQKFSQINMLDISWSVGSDFFYFFCYDCFAEHSAVLHLFRKERQGELTRKFLFLNIVQFNYIATIFERV